MRTVISAAISLDGYLDDRSPERLRLSGQEDWENVLALRTRCDAILVGAGTVRADDPSLVIKDPEIRRQRSQTGMEPEPLKVTVTRSGNLNLESGFFTRGNGRKLVFCERSTPVERIREIQRIAEVITVPHIDPEIISDTLGSFGVRVLLVEGGSSVLGMYMKSGNFDCLRLATAPFFVGDGRAPRFVPDGQYPWNKDNRLVLRDSIKLGNTSVMYMVPPAVCEKDAEFLKLAVEASRQSPPCDTAYRVGAVVVTPDGAVFQGFTHETGPADHAEEAAIAKAEAAGVGLAGSTIYSSMEPCTHRRSKPLSCADLLIIKGFAKVVYGLAEPAYLALCEGHARLQKAGLEVYRDRSFDGAVRTINAHILNR